ncbi:hypothetical protein C8R45DRAFT_393491 [Mycena sanguinolenta]|nr:hypothetical protein C8R45DRAFT_393491 [Mycena sanguinolenta]
MQKLRHGLEKAGASGRRHCAPIFESVAPILAHATRSFSLRYRSFACYIWSRSSPVCLLVVWSSSPSLKRLPSALDSHSSPSTVRLLALDVSLLTLFVFLRDFLSSLASLPAAGVVIIGIGRGAVVVLLLAGGQDGRCCARVAVANKSPNHPRIPFTHPRLRHLSLFSAV